ncbi:hypothetical protein HRQ91_10425 [Treponema parvum]|uniref:Ribulose-phosphate 3-epimerase n=1 Tax=Treponema parvum TaxID=138851 RepID=A0A975F5R4_9SPIR|nr:hypothetical protein [Treponema parvum]QTQ14845.1 hypothetical protein HRQ91_10425 [Treponema parvum]
MKISISLFACPHDYLSYSNLFSIHYADSIHVDIMDGICVPLVGVSYDALLKISRLYTLPIQIHLMVQNQMSELERILPLSAIDTVFLTIEKEPIDTILACLQKIRQAGKKAAIALWPETDIEMIESFITNIDNLLVMTTKAGVSQSTFLQTSYTRIENLLLFLKKKEINLKIGVDGGMTAARLSKIKHLGVSYAVVGRSFFVPEEQVKIINLKLRD